MRKPAPRPKPKAKPSLHRVKYADDDELETEAVEIKIPVESKPEEPPVFGKKDDETDKFKRYRKFELAEMRPYVEGEDMTNIKVGDVEAQLGCPKKGDMVCRNEANHDDQWLLAEEKFKHHYEAI